MKGYISFFFKWSINILVYDGEQMISIIQPFVRRYFVVLNIKLFNVRVSAKNIVITFVATVCFGWLSRNFFTAFIPSALGMLVILCQVI